MTTEEDPVVSLEDISAIRAFLFKRWLPAFAKAGLQVLTLVALGTAVLFLFMQFMLPDQSSRSSFILCGSLMLALGLLPYGMFVSRMMWLDVRISRSLQRMATRVRAGETVYASELKL